MKKALPGIVLLLLAGCANTTQPCEKIEDEAARAIIVNYFRAISEKDYEGLVTLSSRDYTLFEDGMVWNNDSLIAAIKTMPEAAFEYDLKDFSFEADCNGSFVSYANHGRVTLNDTTHLDFYWVESAYVKKEDGRLKLDFLHSSVAK